MELNLMEASTRDYGESVALLGCDRLTVTVEVSVIDSEHSFKQWQRTDDGRAQVQLKAGKTHFRHDHRDVYVFRGLRWFPSVDESHLQATVDLHRVGDREHIATHLTGGEFTVRDLIDGLNHGDIEPIAEPSNG